MFFTIQYHYKDLESHLTLEKFGGLLLAKPSSRHQPVSSIHQGALEALRYAKLLSDDVTAVHVSIDPAETEKVQRKWKTWGDGRASSSSILPSVSLLNLYSSILKRLLKTASQTRPLTIVGTPQFLLQTLASLIAYAHRRFSAPGTMSKHGVVYRFPYRVRKE